MSVFHLLSHNGLKALIDKITAYFYTKAEIDDMLSAGMKYEVVNELPATGEAGTVYLVPKQSAGAGDVYDEYIYVDGSFEHIGSTEIDLSNYYTKSQADDLLGDKVDKESGKGLSTEDFTTAEKTKLGGIEAGAEVNVQSDWNESDNTKDGFIKNKPTLRQPSADGTAGQYLKSNGNGSAPSWETMDTAPTENSTKAVTSGGVKTALDGKQASVTITTKTDDAGDNDKVIMQDNEVTNTTTFVRRSLSNLLNWFRSKLDSVYVPFEWVITNNDNFSGSAGKHVFNLKTDDGFYGANKRWTVTREIYNIESGELVTTQNVSQLFDGNFERLFTHPTEGEKEVITITPASGATSLKTYFSGTICLHFYNTKEPLSATLKISVKDTPTTFQSYNFTPYRGKVWRSESFNKNYPHTVIIEIIGKSYTGDGQWVATSLTEMSYFGTRNTIGDESALVKHEIEQEMFGKLTSPKFITKGGTSSQYLRGDGSLTTLSTSPTSGSGLPITSGAVYTALRNKQNKFLTFDVPDNAGYATLTLISDITESFSTPNYVGHGIIGFMYGWRAGNLSGSTAQRITCWGNHDTSYVKLQTDNNNNHALKPLLVYYNSRYYLALKKGKRSGMSHYFVGYSANILSTYINLYANSNESKWYSDSGRTTEVTFTITKDYSRYEGGYLDFMGNSSQVVLGTGELKTIDSSVESGSSNLVTSGAVATALGNLDLSGKVNLQPDFTASQIDYSAGNVGKWQKVLRFPDGADLVINMKKTAMGSDSTSTLWFSSSSMGDSYTSLFGNHSVRFIHDGGYVFLVLQCKKSTNEPTEYYTFQIAHSSVPMSDIVAVTDASPITATPKEPSIVYRAPMTTGAVSFNVTNGAGSVAMANHNDFLGNMTSEATNGVVVTMSGATEGQIYRFVFTRNITGGVTFKQSNVAYCTISGDVNAGDTITLTAVSNTADGWLYEQQSAGIKSSDGSINVEYEGSTANLSLNLPPDIVRNNVFYTRNSHLAMAIGLRATCDTTAKAIAVGCDSESGNASVSVGGDAKASNTYCVAVGNSAVATSMDSAAVGRRATASGERSCAYGSVSVASGTRSMAFGYGATADNYSTAFGYNAKAQVNATAYGYEANGENYSVAYGERARAGYRSGDLTYPRYVVKRFTAVDFIEGGETKKYMFINYGSSVTITLNGNSVTLTPPNVNVKFFIIVNDSVASRIYRSITSYARVNGDDTYINTMGGYDIVANAVNGDSYYALWLYGSPSSFPPTVDTFSFLAYYTGTDSSSYQTAIGAGATAIYGNSIAIGAEARAVKQGQTVIGSGAIPNEDDKVIFGNGSGSDNTKKNILRIDSEERLNVRSYVGETQIIDMNQQTGSLGNITKSVYRIRWDDTGTVNLSLDTGGCVEGQRVTIFAETNDVKIFAQPYIIRQGRFCDFMFLGGAWRPSMGIEEILTT